MAMVSSGPTSGVQVEDTCISLYMELQLHHKSKYIIFKLADDLRKIVVDKVGCKDATYDDFVEELLEAARKGEGRYGVFDQNYQLRDRKISKIVFFTWIPDAIKVKQKMLYSSSLKAFKNKLPGIHVDMQCNDDCDLQHCNMMQKCMEKGYD